VGRRNPDSPNNPIAFRRDIRYTILPTTPADLNCPGVAVDTKPDFERLLTDLRAGDPAAVAEVSRRYGGFLRAAIRRKLHPGLRARLDSMDVVQDVWASFLNLPADRLDFRNSDDLLKFLTQVAYNRTVELFRKRFETQRDDIHRELPLDALPGGREVFPGPTPTPSVCVSAGEEWERLLGQFPEPQRVILRRLQEGHDNRDIAKMANVSLATVNRVVRRLKDMTGA